jgi:rod shape determining protein RodA
MLLTLAAGSLFILYSASGKNWDLVLKQATSFGLGLLACWSSRSSSRASWRAGYRWPTWAAWPCWWRGSGRLHGDGGHALDQHSRGDPLPAFGVHEDHHADAPSPGICPRSLPPSIKHTCDQLALIGVPFVLILKQPDLGTALLVLASGAFVLFIGGSALALDHQGWPPWCRSPWRCGTSCCAITRNSGC